MFRFFLGWLTALALAGQALAAPAPAPVKVFAAASLTEALAAAAAAYAAQGHPRPVLAFAASSTLARQIEQGADADLFVSADEEWMDYLQARGLIEAKTRARLLSNRLVLIAPSDRPFTLAMRQGFDLAGALKGGRLALADPDSVPAGRYGKAALESVGAWAGVSGSVARAENVRAALRFVETGEAAAGIVYATDAQAAGSRVTIVGTFPAASHPPISYPLALVAGRAGRTEAAAFARYLRSPPGQKVLQRFGFGPPRND